MSHIPQQTLVDTPYRKSAYTLSQIFPIHLYRNGHTDGFRLVIVFQRFVVPNDIGINGIFRTRLIEHELRHRTWKEWCFRNIDPHTAISRTWFYFYGNARLGVTQIYGVGRLNDLGIGRSHRENGRRKNISSQLVSYLKAGSCGRELEHRHSYSYKEQSDNRPKHLTFALLEIYLNHFDISIYWHNKDTTFLLIKCLPNLGIVGLKAKPRWF